MQYCRCKQLKMLKVETDFSADPLWCAVCSSNLDADDFPLSEALKQALFEWINDYGTWIDWESDGIIAGGVAMEAAHNERGAELTKRVRNEITQYEVVFSPATFAKRTAEA